MESVTSTATPFVLRRYKEMDVELWGGSVDERGSYSFCWIIRRFCRRLWWKCRYRGSENILISPNPCKE